MKHSLQMCSNNPAPWWTIQSALNSEGNAVILQKPLYRIAENLKNNEVLYLQINKKGLEPDLLTTEKGDGELFIKKLYLTRYPHF